MQMQFTSHYQLISSQRKMIQERASMFPVIGANSDRREMLVAIHLHSGCGVGEQMRAAIAHGLRHSLYAETDTL